MDYQYEEYTNDDALGDYDDSSYDEESLTLSESLWDSYTNCLLPSLSQVLSYITPMLLSSLTHRVLTTIYWWQCPTIDTMLANNTAMIPMHLISIVCGIYMLYKNLGNLLIVLFLLGLFSYALLQLMRMGAKQRGVFIIGGLTILSQFVYERFIWLDPNTWQQLRGMQMIAHMKVISLACDLAESNKPTVAMPSLLAYLGYIYCPSTCMVGPWVSYSRYLQSLHRRSACNWSSWLRSFSQTALNVAFALVLLGISNCLAPTLGHYQSEHNINFGFSNWLLMYMGSVSVRASHYFVCFLSQAMLTIGAQSVDSEKAMTAMLGPLMSRPWQIEWPRSLTMLVRSWNIPMHEWLKLYIYTPVRQHTGNSVLAAVLCTYIVSSLLHGTDFRVYVVLLSLAVFSTGERLLRRRLATISDACITANPCRGVSNCCYRHCPSKRGWRVSSSWLVLFINTGFTLLAIYHLAYLGVALLDETTDARGEEMNYVWHWSSNSYLSHYIGVGMFILYLFIS